MKEIQGYLVIIPNNPDGRGLLCFTLETANERKRLMSEMVNKWNVPNHFDKSYWKEEPEMPKIYSLIVGEEIKE